MDVQKDIQKSEGLAKFVETQSAKTNPFGDNRVGERAYRRAERVSAALFILTSHLPESEPLRVQTREKGIALLNDVLALRNEMRALNSSRANDLKASVRALISMVRLLGIAGFVSLQNAEIVSDALDELSGFLAASQRSTLSETHAFNREDLIDVREQVRAPRVKSGDISLSDSDVRDTVAIKDKTLSEPSSGSVAEHARPKGLNVRSQSILEVLRVSGELGIRDIASNLPEYSEKMIQRELLHLVAMRKVQKKGLKRWSTYGLIDA